VVTSLLRSSDGEVKHLFEISRQKGDAGSKIMSIALFLNLGRSACSDGRCDALSRLSQSLPALKIVELPSDAPLSRASCVPTLVIARLDGSDREKSVLETCRARWPEALLIAVVCGAPKNSGLLPSLLTLADDFLFCSALTNELPLRSERILSLRCSAITQAGTENLADLPLVGQSPAFSRVIEKTASLARSAAAVLICGETGSGKELVARAIHYRGPRHSKPFIPINCGALPDHLFENELFGHNKGAFTDASSAEQGLVAEAEGGTLFLDEVDTLSPSAQIKLLRVLQNGEYRPLGSARSSFADVRVIAATNCDLNEKVRLKQFRVDLFYRLNVLTVELPPLRERGADVIVLAEYFLDQYGDRENPACPRLSEAARQKLCGYSWPGNVRELQAVMQRAALLKSGGILHAADIDLPEGESKDRFRHESLRRAKTFVIGEFERSYVADLLARHQGNITQAAKAAGKDRRTLQRLVKKYSLDRASFKL
jgi:DNA-binding NtrC family response regulator